MAEQKDLSGQRALVTGSGRGIGAAIAIRLAQLGANLVLCGRTMQSLEATATEVAKTGGGALSMTCDVGELESVSRLARYVKTLGRLDILVNNAGVGDFSGSLHELQPEVWERILRTNLTGVYHMIHEFAPMMIQGGGGHIINISSIASKNPLPNGAAYAASKWGLNGLSYSVAEELRGHNIRVSVVCPGSVQTEFSPHSGKDPRKMLRPEDVAHAVEMLITQSARSFASEIVLRPTMKP